MTANHAGYYRFSICNLEDPSTYEEEECFEDLEFADGSDKFFPKRTDKQNNVKVKLPDGLTCERCVFRWTYRAGKPYPKLYCNCQAHEPVWLLMTN